MTDNITKNISIITLFFLVSGVVYNYGFYSQFQIEITEYLTPGEIILSFVPVIIPLILSLFLVIYFSIYKTQDADKEKSEDEFLAKRDFTFWGPFKELYRFIFGRLKSGGSRSRTWLYFLRQIPGRLILLSVFCLYTVSFVVAFIYKSGYPINTPIALIIISFLWLIIIVSEVDKHLSKIEPKLKSFFLQLIIVLGFLGILYLFGTYKAYRILENKPFYNIELRARGGSFQSSDSLIYIGKTRNYYFLREIHTNRNIIIKNDEVGIVYLEPIQKKKGTKE